MKREESRLLEALKDAEGFVSGEKLGRELGISRAAVWKQVKELRRLGYSIKATPHRGYRLEQTPDLLLPGELYPRLRTRFCGSRIYYYTTLDSTNRLADTLGARQEKEGALVVSEEQTGGKGRRGRGWHSPPGLGIYMSLLFYPCALSPEMLSPFTAAAAITAACSLQECIAVPAAVKWPNDLFLKGKKFGGLLAEVKGNEEEVHYLVLGLGLNVNQGVEDFPEELKQTATSLRRVENKFFSRVEICCRLLQDLEDSYLLFLREGFAPFREAWKRNSITLGRKVAWKRGEELREGTARDIDTRGALVLEDSAGETHRLTSGEVEVGEEICPQQGSIKRVKE